MAPFLTNEKANRFKCHSKFPDGAEIRKPRAESREPRASSEFRAPNSEFFETQQTVRTQMNVCMAIERRTPSGEALRNAPQSYGYPRSRGWHTVPVIRHPKHCVMRKLLIVLGTALGALALGKGPDVTAASAIVVDADSGKVLYSKNADVPRFPASTTKVMTGLLLAEECQPDDTIVGPSDVESITGSKMHLKPGEKVSAHDMLYALMLRSANDGCYAVALHIAGSVPAFAKLMNQRAQELGCTHTHFHNPNGLNDTQHLTTAHDLAYIARAAIKNPEFAEAVRTSSYTIARSMDQEDTLMVNKDKLLLWDPSAEGIKTGWTIPAGHCFVGCSNRNGYRIISVVMKSADWKKDTETLWNWAFQNHDRELVRTANDPIQTVAVEDGAADQVSVAAAQDIYLTVPKGEQPAFQLTVKPMDKVEAPITVGERVGTIMLTDNEGAKMYFPAIATQEVPKKGIAAAATTGWTPWLGLTLIGGTLFVRGKSKRSKLYAARRLAQKRAYLEQHGYRY